MYIHPYEYTLLHQLYIWPNVYTRTYAYTLPYLLYIDDLKRTYDTTRMYGHEIFQSSNLLMCRCSDVLMFRCFDVLMFRSSDLMISKSSDFHIFRSSYLLYGLIPYISNAIYIFLMSLVS